MQVKDDKKIKDERNFGGGHCFLFWGEEDKAYTIIGKVVISILTLGVLPIVWLIKKMKSKKKSMGQSAR